MHCCEEYAPLHDSFLFFFDKPKSFTSSKNNNNEIRPKYPECKLITD